MSIKTATLNGVAAPPTLGTPLGMQAHPGQANAPVQAKQFVTPATPPQTAQSKIGGN